MGGRYILVLIAVLLLSSAYAADVELVSPADNVQFDPTIGEFVFVVKTHDAIKDCSLFIDNESAKTITYNDFLTGKNLQLQTAVSDGAHIWHIVCTTEKQILTTPSRTITVKNPVVSSIQKTGGAVRGTTIYTFSATTVPLSVPRLAAGDSIVVKAGEKSNEWYIKQSSIKDDVPFLLLQEKKTKETLHLYQNNASLVLIGNVGVILTFSEISLNRATIIAQLASAPPVTTPPPATPQTPEKAEQATPPPTTPPLKVDEKPVEQPLAPQEDTEAPTTPTPEPKKPGMFTRFISWLSSILG